MKKIVFSIAAIVLLDQLKLFLHKITISNKNNSMIFLITIVLSLILSFIEIYVIVKLFEKKMR